MPKKHHHLLIFSLILHLSLSCTDSLTLPSDISALQAFKSTIKPSSIPPSSCLDSWHFSSDPCSLPRRTHFICGITCSPDSSRVISITLDSVGYSGTLTPLVSKLTQLVTLDLGQNSFHGTIPSSLSSLSLLQSLSFRTNYFSGPLPSSIGTLKSLQDLDLSGNSLSGSLPTTLFSLSKLTRLDLSYNKFSGNLPKLPPALVELAIKANSLSGSIPKSSLDGLTELETVELSSNLLTGVLQGWFFQLPSLQQVNLANNSLTGVEIWRPAKEYHSNLVAVDLGYNKIEGSVPVNFSEYPVLASLSLRHNLLRGPIPAQFTKKGTLKRIYLDGNYLSGSPPAGFFAGAGEVSGSLGDNCLRGCPASSTLCTPSQKPMSVCKQAYSGRKKRPRV